MARPMNHLYDSDILTWSEQKAALLRRIAVGERINDLVDRANVIEEVESIGREQSHQVELLLVQALVRVLKAAGWRASRTAPHRRAEARRLRAEATARSVPSVAQPIDLAGLYRLALAAVPETIDGRPPVAPPEHSPMRFEGLLAEP
ncbi:MAG: DUF29 family protein [Acetobacteraceae bacterium]